MDKVFSAQKFIEDILEYENIPYFRGGSREFGWESENSDFDYFLLINEEMNNDYYGFTMNKSINFKHTYGLTEKENQNYPGHYHFETNILGVEFDLIVFNSPMEWEYLKNQHEQIKKYLTSLRESTRYILFKTLKLSGLPGKDKYRLVRRLMLGV